MGKGEMADSRPTTPKSPVSGRSSRNVSRKSRRILREAIEENRFELALGLDANSTFLTHLSKAKFISGNDLIRFERHKTTKRRNQEIIETVLRYEADVPDSYDKFLNALRASDQNAMANLLTNVEKELDTVDRYQDTLENLQDDVSRMLKKEERRAGIQFRSQSPESKPAEEDEQDSTEMKRFLKKVHRTTRNSLIQMDRAKEVIEKLHNDGDQVAMKNADLLSKLRDCDNLVRRIMPKDALMAYDHENDDNVSVMGSALNMKTPRSKESEADMILKSIQRKLQLIDEDRIEHKESDDICEMIVDNMLDDVEERKAVLEKNTEPPPRYKKGYNKYTAKLPQDPESSRRPNNHRIEPLRVKIEELSEVLECYTHQERQITHKANLGKYSTSMKHRNFDEIDDDLVHLKKEVQRDDPDEAMEVAQRIVDKTRTEREQCLEIIDEMEKDVRLRRIKLQEVLSRGSGNVYAKRRIPIRKVRTVRKTDSSFQKRLNDLHNELKVYMAYELDQNHQKEAELTRKRQECDRELKATDIKMMRMEKRIREAEGERGKFKKLYNQERVHGSMILNKPTIVRRSTHSPEMHRERDRGRRSRSVDDNYKFKDRKEVGDRSKRKTFRIPGAGPVRATNRNIFNDREETPPENRPLLSNRARHLTTIREDHDKYKLPDINSGRHS